MDGPRGYAQISIAAVRALARADAGDFEVFLPTTAEEGPVLYHKSGAGLSVPDFSRMAEGGLSHLFVRIDDFQRCEETLENKLSDILSNPHIASSDKAQIIHGTGTSVARDLTHEPISSQGLRRTSNIVDGMIGCVLEDPKVAGHLLEMAGHERTTASHMIIVATLAVMLGAEVYGSDEEMLSALGFAGMLHDLGKLSIDADILNKNGRLTRAEMELLHQHPIESVRLVAGDAHVTPIARRMILQHHERVDGQGYPIGVKGTDLFPGSRLLSIVDSFHAMIGRRTYRAPLGPNDANRVMATQAGKQFDPDLLECWRRLCERHRTIARTDERAEPTSLSPFAKGGSGVGDGDEVASRYEHRPFPASPKVTGPRQPRFDCKENTTIRCVYAGRLTDVNNAPPEFNATMHDVSRGGLCLYTAHPMYRGEIVHVRIRTEQDGSWIRSMVAWCRQQEDNLYRIGLRFDTRIPASRSCQTTEVCSALDRSRSRTNSEGPGEARPADAPVISNPTPVRDKRTAAMQKLAAISAMRKPSRDAQRMAITLAMSEDLVIRLKVVDVLTNLQSRAGRDALVAMINDVHPDVREKAAFAAGTAKIREAIEPLRHRMQHSDDAEALRAAGALGLLGDSSGLRLVTRMLEKNDPNARLAARVLGDIVGHRFSANGEGIKAARRYLAAKNLVA